LPEFHGVVSLLQTCFISEFAYVIIMLVLVCIFIFGSIFHVWEKTCCFCICEPGLVHLTWCPPIVSIYLQTTCPLFLMAE
jgi:hypothetical protein